MRLGGGVLRGGEGGVSFYVLEGASERGGLGLGGEKRGRAKEGIGRGADAGGDAPVNTGDPRPPPTQWKGSESSSISGEGGERKNCIEHGRGSKKKKHTLREEKKSGRKCLIIERRKDRASFFFSPPTRFSLPPASIIVSFSPVCSLLIVLLGL